MQFHTDRGHGREWYLDTIPTLFTANLKLHTELLLDNLPPEILLKLTPFSLPPSSLIHFILPHLTAPSKFTSVLMKVSVLTESFRFSFVSKSINTVTVSRPFSARRHTFLSYLSAKKKNFNHTYFFIILTLRNHRGIQLNSKAVN